MTLSRTLFIAILLAGCTTVPVVVELPCPEPLELIKIDRTELQDIDINTYNKMVRRDQQLRERIFTLREIMSCE